MVYNLFIVLLITLAQISRIYIYRYNRNAKLKSSKKLLTFVLFQDFSATVLHGSGDYPDAEVIRNTPNAIDYINEESVR